MTTRSLLLLLVAACGTDDPAVEATANAAILPTTGQTVNAMAVFTATSSGVAVEIAITDAAPGIHGMHIHQVPDCGMDGMSAGGHWDGSDASGDPGNHGLPDASLHHIGDLGNVTVAADGTGTLSHANELWTLGDGALTDVVGHAIIFHALTDDGSMPSAGARHGCGIVVPNP